MKTEQLKQELEWWRTYGEYVANVHNNVDAEACGFADGDNEYKDNFN
jgi:3-keto-L-gulonate-6-phosphate decarboxylase